MPQRIFRFLASLNLALVLLAVVIFAAALGTTYETKFNAAVARKYIYGHWWFDLWLALLCVNLFCAALLRYPWKPRKIGFVITHFGIITLLTGGLLDRLLGVEGFLGLNRGAAPVSVMELREEELDVFAEGGSATTTIQLATLTRPDERRFAVNSPSPKVTVAIRDVKPVIAATEMAASDTGPAAVRVTLQGEMLGRNEQVLFLRDEVNLGVAKLAFLPGKPVPAEPPAAGDKLVPRLERHFIFAKFEDMAIVKTLAGEPTGAAAKLVVDAAGAPELQLALLGKKFKLAARESAGAAVPLKGLDGWSYNLVGYYPNLKMVDGKPTTEGDKPDNPAVCFELTGPLVKAGEPPAETSPHGGAMGGGKAGAKLSIFLGPDGKLRYVLKAQQGEKTGDLEVNRAVPLNWGAANEFVVNEFLPHTAPRTVWKPLEGSLKDGADMEGVAHGLLCRVSAGGESQEVWIAQSPPQNPQREVLQVGGEKVGLLFTNRTAPLPFTVALLKFSAPFQEGMEGSSNFMAFESILSFDGQEDTVWLKPDSLVAKERGTDILSGAITEIAETSFTLEPDRGEPLTIPRAEISRYEQLTHKISMNHPANYPATWYGAWLGTSYKFSQASHDMPRNPDYSGVQVLRDPGWMPKWVGCLMICLGIFTMFYIKPYFKKEEKKADGKE